MSGSHRLYNYILAMKNYHERLHEDWQALFDKAVMIRDNRNKVLSGLCEDTGDVFDRALYETVLESLKPIIEGCVFLSE